MSTADGGFAAGSGSGEGRLPARILAAGIVLGLVVGGLLGALAGALQSRTYQATTIASVLPDDALTTAATVSGTTSTEDSSDFIQGELVVITSQGLRATVQQRLKLGGLPAVSASQSGTTDIVDITASAASPALAQRVADTTRIVYAQQRAQELMSDVTTATTQVENQISAVRKQIAATPGAATNSNSPLEQEYARLLAVDSDLALDSAQSSSAVSTIQTAVVGDGGLSDTTTYGLGGAVLGILVAAAALVALRRLRPRVYDVRDLVGFDADVLTPVLPVDGRKAVRAARVLVSRMSGGSRTGRTVVLVGTQTGSASEGAISGVAVALHDAGPVLLLARPGSAASLLATLPAGAQRLSAADLSGKRSTTARLTKLSAGAAPVRLAVVDATIGELTTLASTGVLDAASDAGWATVADAPPLGESRLAVVLAESAGSATVLVEQGGADPSDVEATVAALRGAGVSRVNLLLHEQPAVWRRLTRRVTRAEGSSSSALAEPAPQHETSSRPSPDQTPARRAQSPTADSPRVGAAATSDATEKQTPTAGDSRQDDAISNVRPLRPLRSPNAATEDDAETAPTAPDAQQKPARPKRTRGEST
jgi:hypothetical protein